MQTTKPPGKAWRTWPTRAEVLKEYAITAAQLGALCRHKRLVAYACQDKTTRFDPKQLEAAFALEPEEPPGELGAAVDPVNAGLRDLVTVLVGSIKDTRDSTTKVLEAATKLIEGTRVPMEKALAFYERIFAVQEDWSKRLETGWLAGIEAREAMIDRSHERELVGVVVSQEHAIKKQAIDMASGLAPELLKYLKVRSAAEQALSFVLEVDESMLVAAQQMGLVSEEKLGALRKLRATAAAAKAPPAPAPEKTNGADSPSNGAEAPKTSEE